MKHTTDERTDRDYEKSFEGNYVHTEPRRRRCAPRCSPSVPSERATAAFSRRKVRDVFEEYQKRTAGRFAEQEKIASQSDFPRKGKKTQDAADKEKAARFSRSAGV